jgi:bifunctional UDP-N-acetylglucosamine pyrophosphorylase/glucosamine-1-phosphate N-acetyltransferase
MRKIQGLIAAAGRGSRSGLDYPKTLYEIDGVSILRRILKVMAPYSACPIIIASPAGESAIKTELLKHDLAAEIVLQAEPKGMGDAVLRYEQSRMFSNANDEHLLLMWGDLPFIQQGTVDAIISLHLQDKNDFSLVTKKTKDPYTIIQRDAAGRVLRAIETRECPEQRVNEGERDIGVFVFNRRKTFDILKMDLPSSLSRTTGEHGFLYCIEESAKRGALIGAYPLAVDSEEISLNYLADLAAIGPKVTNA